MLCLQRLCWVSPAVSLDSDEKKYQYKVNKFFFFDAVYDFDHN